MNRICLSLLFAAAALHAQKIEVEFDEAADFSKFRTFTLRDGQINSKAPALNNELVHKKIENAIRKRLTERGLLEAATNPDLNVRFTLGAGRRTEVEAFPTGWRGLGTRVVRVPRTEGTLVIDLRDPTKRALVWRGIAVEDKDRPSDIEGKLDDMVRKAIDKYPPKK